MYKKIVVALSLGHGFAERALGLARKLKDADSKIVAIHVVEPLPASVKAVLSDEQLETSRKKTKAAIAERVSGASDIEAVIITGNPGTSITEYARKIGADLIITGSHEPGLEDFFIGSTASRIMRHAPCSVHVIR